jgi:DNA repair protein RadC
MNVRLTKEQKIQVANSQDVYKIMRAILMRENKLARKSEHFWVIGLNITNVINYIELVALGSTSEAILTPMEIYNLAVLKKSVKVILVHNHPSGNVTPSAEDLSITHRINEGGKLLGIQLLDHLIISEKSFFSMASHKLL